MIRKYDLIIPCVRLLITRINKIVHNEVLLHFKKPIWDRERLKLWHLRINKSFSMVLYRFATVYSFVKWLILIWMYAIPTFFNINLFFIYNKKRRTTKFIKTIAPRFIIYVRFLLNYTITASNGPIDHQGIDLIPTFW